MLVYLIFVEIPEYGNIGTDEGLAPNRRQVIILSSDECFNDAYMCYSASMS